MCVCVHMYVSIMFCDYFQTDNFKLHTRWKNFGKKLRRLRQQIVKDQAFAFAFDKVCLDYV